MSDHTTHIQSNKAEVDNMMNEPLNGINQKNKVGAILIVGGGIAGMQAALDLGDSGFKVYLIEKSPAIGGFMSRLDKTFPTNDCAMCIMSPKLVATGRHPNINIMAFSEIDKLEGEAGNFKVTIKKNARFVDEKKCINCGMCGLSCPVRIPDEFNETLSVRSAIYIPYPQAIPSIYIVDPKRCLYLQKGICRICERICPAKAVDFTQKDQLITLDVGSIILASGTTPIDPRIKNSYGYGIIPNIITSTQYERLLSASGPFGGHIVRPFDRQEPKKIAWLQCVGSRDESIGHNFCSSVCCMQATKEAIITQEHNPEIECHIFHMDVRAFGKGFEEYYQNALKMGIKYTRCRFSNVSQVENMLKIRYEDESGTMQEELFDILVLSVGIKPSKDMIEFANKLDIKLDSYNFCKTSTFNPLETNKPGIYVCGTFLEPKDIPDTVAQASGAATRASGIIASERFSLIASESYPREIDVENQDLRIGVLVCDCGINIKSTVRVDEVVEYVKKLPNVAHAEEVMYACSQDTQEKIKQLIQDKKLNRFVVASCTPRTHEPLFQKTLKKAGLNPYLFSMGNIREHCAWVHRADKDKATEKAKDIVLMALSRASFYKPISNLTVPIKPSGIVIGGGIAGMVASLNLAEQGFLVSLIEKSDKLGGMLHKINHLASKEDPKQFLDQLITKIKSDQRIKTFLNAEIEEIGGYLGNFKATIKSNGKVDEIEGGAVIIATGGQEYKPKEYLYDGVDQRILTQLEFESKLIKNEIAPKTVVMIQCVGSRCPEREYCSRICCTEAMKNALLLKAKNPNSVIYVLYRDIRTYGLKEEYYREARLKGVLFIRYEPENAPKVTKDANGLTVKILDPFFKREITINPDILVLSAAVVPNEVENLVTQLKLPLTKDKFFLEAHMKLRPVDFSTEGIYLCGLAHSPRFIDETISQASAAVARACTILSRKEIEIEGIISQINRERCVACGICVQRCPFDAIKLVSSNHKMYADVNPIKCHGCGICASDCPRGAAELLHYEDENILTQLENLASNQT